MSFIFSVFLLSVFFAVQLNYLLSRPAEELPSETGTPSAQAKASEERAPSAHASPVRAEPREPSPPPTRTSDAIVLEPPEGDATEGQRSHDIQMGGSSAPTGGNLGASSIGAEATHDKTPVVPEHPPLKQKLYSKV